MARKILSVGITIPGGDVEEVALSSRRSLLDADIIIFAPKVPYEYTSQTFQGKPCLSDDASFRAKESLAHWRKELTAAKDAEKLILVLLRPPEEVYVATGDIEYSGTGRNARGTRTVTLLSAYEALSVKCTYHTASGKEMTVVSEARFFMPYWTEFEEYSQYEVYLEAQSLEVLVKTKTGNRVVGACIRKGRGATLLVPNLDLDIDSFVETRKVGKEEAEYWSKTAKVFEHKFTSTLIALADALAADLSVTPPPPWAQNDAYRLSEEAILEKQIEQITVQVTQFEDKKQALEAELEKAGGLRGLLYEQGKPLERAVLAALKLIGFDAQGLNENGSEFDAVFTSEEGRFLGEAEGKDNKAINIDKFSQLERNLSEDFAREEVKEHAKGVLFGNAFRLQPIAERQNPFTDKCQKAAERLKVALVSTPDLFEPARYLKTTNDPEYAKKCRGMIFQTSGEIVKFPAPPISESTIETINKTSLDA